MKKTIIIAAILSWFALPSFANAADIKPYAGIGLGGYTFKGIGTSFGGFGQFGADISDYFGAEIRLGASSKKAFTSGTTNEEVKLDHIFSYLAKVQAPINENIHAYVLLGGSTAKATATITTPNVVFLATGTNTISSKSSSFSFGGGLDFQIQDSLSIGAEYMRYYKDVSGFSANLKFIF
jgi:opacity protein-like surface antigen